MDKNILRDTLRKKRQRMSPEQQIQAQTSLAKIVCTSNYFLQSKNIAVYHAIDGEINPIIIVKKAWELGKQCFLPVCLESQNLLLKFLPFNENTPLHINHLNIPEPPYNSQKLILAQQLDLVLCPLTGFDTKGHRLGMGKGYYDYTFSFTQETTTPILLGLAHECQKTDKIPTNKYDIPLHGIATDTRIYLTKTPSST